MALQHEISFYEVMWRAWSRGLSYPFPWWVEQYLRRWSDAFDGGLFDSKEAAFASNAAYRYWHMTGVKDRREETLVSQSGDVEPVYDQYALAFFALRPGGGLCLPHSLPPPAGRPQPVVDQGLADGYLPVVVTVYRPWLGVTITQRVLATTIGSRQRTVGLVRFTVSSDADTPPGRVHDGELGCAVVPAGPSGFQRHDRAGRYLANGAVGSIQYWPGDRRVEVNGQWGPVFDVAPSTFGTYGNPTSSLDPEHYLLESPFAHLAAGQDLNGVETATDAVGGLCTATFTWPFHLVGPGDRLEVDVRLPIDDYRGGADLVELRSVPASTLDATNTEWWREKLATGFQLALPPRVAHLGDLVKLCRANILILADDGAIHPGPTIYDGFWVRDSTVEGIACALVGEEGLPERQFATHFPRVFNTGDGWVGPARRHGYFGGAHELQDHEWDSNGEVLWAFGRLDRILGSARQFGAGLFTPYILDGARWLRDNRSEFGLLHSGWSAEHIGDRDKPHYWDDLWAIAGLYEAWRLADRMGAPQTAEIRDAYDDVVRATQASIRYVLGEQRRQGHWKTFVPTGPGDIGRLDSTIVGAVAYFHPCRLHIGAKLGGDVDTAFRATLETIWHDFVTDGGFRHQSAWRAYGPYLTLQIAHAFLFIGDIDRMDACLGWAVGRAAYARLSRWPPGSPDDWAVALGAWNEQHAYAIASDFTEAPDDWWYMGDIPHGWAAAELLLLLRDSVVFEADEDGDRHLYLAAGIPPHWLGHRDALTINAAPTAFGSPVSYSLRHDADHRTLHLQIARAPTGVRFVVPCRHGTGPVAVTADGQPIATAGPDVALPAGTTDATIRYS